MTDRITNTTHPQEDDELLRLVGQLGVASWVVIAARMRGRSAKSCRLRWCNQLSPDVLKSPFTEWEQAVVVRVRLCTEGMSERG